MISRAKIDCRILLRPGVTPAQRLGVMEIVEKWSVALTGAKPTRFIGASQIVRFDVELDRDTARETLRRCLPIELVRDVLVNGVSWNR